MKRRQKVATDVTAVTQPTCPACGGIVEAVDRAFVVDDPCGRLYFRDRCARCGYELFRSEPLEVLLNEEGAN